MKILIVKTSSLGDIVHVFPVISYLKSIYSNSKIDWVVEKPFSALVEAHPDINTVHVIESKKWRKGLFKQNTWQEIKEFHRKLKAKKYDVLIDLQGNIKSGLITFLAHSPVKIGFGYHTVPEKPNLLTTTHRYNPPLGQNIREDYLFLATSFFQKEASKCQTDIVLKISQDQASSLNDILVPLQKGMRILVCQGSNWPNKQLDPQTLLSFLKKIHQEYSAKFLFAWGNDQEKQQAALFHQEFLKSSIIVPKLSLPVLQNLIAKVDLVIAMDSLPLHLAATTKTPTFSVFGPSSSHKYKPSGNQHYAFQGACPYGKTFEKRCTILRTCSTGLCMKGIQTSALFETFETWWLNKT